MIEDTLQARAARRAAEQLRAIVLRLGAEASDINIATDGRGAQLQAVRSAGVSAEFGNTRRPALRRIGRALEAVRRGETS
jgi:hypothetical protein